LLIFIKGTPSSFTYNLFNNSPLVPIPNVLISVLILIP
jgi:hypothetical protein